MSNKVALHTLGCKLNFSETSTIGNQFINNGYSVVDFKDNADVYVFNTCTVTENAERECRQLIRRALRKNPAAYIIVTGCYAQLRPYEIASIEGVDAVLGSDEKFNLFSILQDFNKKELTCISVGTLSGLNDFGSAYSTEADSRTRAFLKIQDGCDYNCSFCTIPLARGSSRSLALDKAIDQLKILIDQGYKEIILTGVNVGDYGKNISKNLFDLLKGMIYVNGDFRIRISSIEPNLLSDDILTLVSQSEKMCKHFHIPLQSGSPRVLKAMQRRYTSEYYEQLILKAKELIPELGIGVDVIVGFPGETEEEFIHTHNFLRDLPVSYLHVFTYSERPDTKAINMSGYVDIIERKRRNNILRNLSDKKKIPFYQNMTGTVQQVIFEGADHDGFMYGFTSNYIKVKTVFNPELTNEICNVLIGNYENGMCNVEVLSTKNSVDLVKEEN